MKLEWYGLWMLPERLSSLKEGKRRPWWTKRFQEFPNDVSFLVFMLSLVQRIHPQMTRHLPRYLPPDCSPLNEDWPQKFYNVMLDCSKEVRLMWCTSLQPIWCLGYSSLKSPFSVVSLGITLHYSGCQVLETMLNIYLAPTNSFAFP